MRPPVFFAITRSFWLGVVPALAVLLDVAVSVVLPLLADVSAGPPVAGLIAAILGADAAKVEGAMRALAPLFALIVAHQRAGQGGEPPRPYTIRPTRETLR